MIPSFNSKASMTSGRSGIYTNPYATPLIANPTNIRGKLAGILSKSDGPIKNKDRAVIMYEININNLLGKSLIIYVTRTDPNA